MNKSGATFRMDPLTTVIIVVLIIGYIYPILSLSGNKETRVKLLKSAYNKYVVYQGNWVIKQKLVSGYQDRTGIEWKKPNEFPLRYDVIIENDGKRLSFTTCEWKASDWEKFKPGDKIMIVIDPLPWGWDGKYIMSDEPKIGEMLTPLKPQ